MSIFVVTVEVEMVVEAENELKASSIAIRYLSEEPAENFSTIEREITKISELPNGWDKQCLPWGGDGKRRLEEILRP